MRRILFFLVTTACVFSGLAQKADETTGRIYFGWGYTRAWYTKSTIHFVNNNGTGTPGATKNNSYDFVIHDVTAHDRPDFDKLKDVINITIPQFVGRLGISINRKWGFEINYDHTKYVVDDYQRARITGRIDQQWLDKDTTIDPTSLLHFEHTDGANFWLFNAVRKWEIFNLKKRISLMWMLKPGIGFVMPRTDVTMFGTRLNNNWKVAGWITSLESGARLKFFDGVYLEFVGKLSYADYMNCFVIGKGNGRANHTFGASQLTLTLGYEFSQLKRFKQSE